MTTGTRESEVVGVISETDLMLRQVREPRSAGPWARRLRLLSRGARRRPPRAAPVRPGGVMSTPAVTVRPGATVAEAARLMAGQRIERLPVVDEEDRLIGIVTRRDLLQVFLRTDDEIRRDVQQGVFVDTLWLAPHTVETAVREGVVTLTGQLERRSDIPIAVGMTRRLDGVVDVVDRLSYRIRVSWTSAATTSRCRSGTQLCARPVNHRPRTPGAARHTLSQPCRTWMVLVPVFSTGTGTVMVRTPSLYSAVASSPLAPAGRRTERAKVP